MSEPLKIGDKFGSLTITGPGEKGTKWYVAKCICGAEDEFLQSKLLHHLNTRCGKRCAGAPTTTETPFTPSQISMQIKINKARKIKTGGGTKDVPKSKQGDPIQNGAANALAGLIDYRLKLRARLQLIDTVIADIESWSV